MKASFKNRYGNSSGLKKAFWRTTLFIVCSIGLVWGQVDVYYPGVISIQPSERRRGTGFLYSRPDILVTAFHVIVPDQYNSGESLKNYISLYHRPKAEPIAFEDIEIVALDAKYDLAVLKIKGFRSETFYSSHPTTTDLQSLELDREIKVVGFVAKQKPKNQTVVKGLTSGDANFDYPGSGSFIGFVHDKKDYKTSGISGGPVFLASDNSVLGVYIERGYGLLECGFGLFVSVNNLQLMLQNPSLSCKGISCIKEELRNLHRQALDGNDRQSQYILARFFYSFGNEKKSHFWFKKASRNGHPGAQHNLGEQDFFSGRIKCFSSK